MDASGATDLGRNEASVDNEALIESSFRRLLAAVETERERIRSMWNQIEDERSVSEAGLAEYTKDTIEWCQREEEKVNAAYRQLEEATLAMRVMNPMDAIGVLRINCSGRHFNVEKSVMCQLDDSYLNVMFSAEFEQAIPRRQNRLYLDFNPDCFAIMVEYLEIRARNPRDPKLLDLIDGVPPDLQRHMEVLAHALNVRAFIRENSLPRKHGTSLYVRGKKIQATHKGWQIITAEHPLSQARDSYFEIEVLANPDPMGGLCVGVLGHQPTGAEVHRIVFDDGVLYNSGKGLVGKAFAGEDVDRGVTMQEGTTFGVKFRVADRALVFYVNGHGVGTAMLKLELQHKLNRLYPCIGLYVEEQQVDVDFSGRMRRAI
jgi:hypothetical protein